MVYGMWYLTYGTTKQRILQTKVLSCAVEPERRTLVFMWPLPMASNDPDKAAKIMDDINRGFFLWVSFQEKPHFGV